MEMKMSKFDVWRKAYENYLVGEGFDPSTGDGKKIVSSIDRVAVESVRKPELLAPFYSPSVHLRALAMAFRTPGSRYYGKEDTIKEVLSQFKKLEETYNLQTPPDDWWTVEIGNPLRILDTLILMYEYLDGIEELTAYWTDIILHFHDAYTLTTHGRRETGANMMWKCHIQILLGILRREQALIDRAKGELPALFCYSHKISNPQTGTFYDDGFYPDGSFIQHYYFAYTGGYGKHFINILSGLLYAFKNTDMEILDDSCVEFFCGMIEKAYAPLIVDGRFMDIARGREPSRYDYQDYICGRHVMRSLCYLSEIVPPAWGCRIRSLLKLWLSKADNRALFCVDEDAFTEYHVNLSLEKVLARLYQDKTAMAQPQRGHYNFGPMCKSVHRHGGWSAAIAMYSKTTACYEHLNGESVKFWHMSDGVTYLYTEDADQYNGDFYATVDMQRLPGTTVDRSKDRASDDYYSWLMPESKNVYDFAGGVTLGDYGIAGMRYRGQGRGKERDLEVKKSWFFLGEEIVCLGSGITSTTGDPIETTVLNQRITKMDECFLTLDGKNCACKEAEGEGKSVKNTLHLTGNKGRGSDIGVVFPGDGEIHVLCEHRKGSWNSTEMIPGHISENDFVTVWQSHGVNPVDAEYSYILLPQASAEDTIRYAEEPEIVILECSAAAHAVKNKATNLTGCNFWEDKPAACVGISVNTCAGVVMQKGEEEVRLAVSDTTKSDSVIEVKLDCDVSEVTLKDEGICILSMTPLTFRVDTAGRNGESRNLVARY